MLARVASAGDPNRWVGATSLGPGQGREFAGKPPAPTESSEEPNILDQPGRRGGLALAGKFRKGEKEGRGARSSVG